MSKKSRKPWKHFCLKRFFWTFHGFWGVFGKIVLPETPYLSRWCVFSISCVPGISKTQFSILSTKPKPKCIFRNTGNFLNHSVFSLVFKVFFKTILKLLQCPDWTNQIKIGLKIGLENRKKTGKMGLYETVSASRDLFYSRTLGVYGVFKNWTCHAGKCFLQTR